MIERVRDRRLHLGAVFPVGLSGHFKRVEVITGDGIVRRVLSFPNLIVDAGLDAIGGTYSLRDLFDGYLAVGTDGTAPAASQTSLGAEVGRTNNNGGFTITTATGPSNEYWEHEVTRVFTEGEVDGVNLAELGMFPNDAGGPMANRQLFRDELGDPTTIQLAADEQLRVIFAWRIYPPSGIQNDSLDIPTPSGTVTTAVDSQAIQIDAANNWGNGGLLRTLGDWDTPTFGFTWAWWETNTLPAETGYPSGNSETFGSVNFLAYTNGNFYRDIEMVAEPAVANFAGGIGGVTWGTFGDNDAGEEVAMSVFDPALAKDDTLRFTFTARLAWARH